MYHSFPDDNTLSAFAKTILDEIKLVFWSAGKRAKKIRSFGRQNKNNIRFLGSVFFEKYYFAQEAQKNIPQFIVYYNPDNYYNTCQFWLFI